MIFRIKSTVLIFCLFSILCFGKCLNHGRRSFSSVFEIFLHSTVYICNLFYVMAKRGIVLLNLGSPDSTEVQDVKKYLMQFLMDETVIDYPYVLRLLLVGGIIPPFRAPKSAEAY